MSSVPLPIPEDDLHALVDGRLAPEQAQQLHARLAADPEKAALVQAWLAQREALRGHLEDVLHEPTPESMRQSAAGIARRRAANDRWWRSGAIAAGLLLAFGLGWTGHERWLALQGGSRALAASPTGFARQALIAHVVYAPEVRHPVEVEAAQQEHLVQWLSKRLGRPLRIPQLSGEGFELVGGRLLPGEHGARAQFMYQSAAGERLTLYIGALPDTREAAAFRFVSEGGASSFYWVERGFGYALTGPLPRQRLLALAQRAHQSLRP